MRLSGFMVSGVLKRFYKSQGLHRVSVVLGV